MRAVIFDLDGTLVHSAPDLHAAAAAMLADLGRSTVTLEQVTGFVGNGVPKLVERALVATGGLPQKGIDGALRIFSDHYERDPTRLTRPYPGVPKMLARLCGAGLALGICTNKPRGATGQVLNGVGLDQFFDAVVGGDTLPVRKPDPATIQAVLDGLNVTACQVAYVGDSETDAATAQNAGLAFALFSGGYRKTPVADLPHDFVFDDFGALTDWLLARAG